jgi:hypothetical protein
LALVDSGLISSLRLTADDRKAPSNCSSVIQSGAFKAKIPTVSQKAREGWGTCGVVGKRRFAPRTAEAAVPTWGVPPPTADSRFLARLRRARNDIVVGRAEGR